jgi:hypothetical protein
MPRLMLVPQGKTFDSWLGCLHALVGMMRAYFPDARSPVIAIAKNHDHVIGGGHPRLIEAVKRLDLGFPNIEWHMLGWPKDLWTLQDVARDHPGFIRSVDSARPFTFARDGVRLDPFAPVPEGAPRQLGYFEDALTEDQREAAGRNVKVFKAMAEARA